MTQSSSNFVNTKVMNGANISMVTVFLFTLAISSSSWGETYSSKGGGKVIVKKELLICDEAKGEGARDFNCVERYDSREIPLGPDSKQYVPCESLDGCRITESMLGAEIFKEVATTPPLSSNGTKVNLKKFHYTVTEDEADSLIEQDSECHAAGFRDRKFFRMVQAKGEELVHYNICVQYVGDCTGTLTAHERKTCTIQNYIFSGAVFKRLR